MSVIMLCEHTHAGFGHATFNAALLSALGTAFPAHTLILLSTQAHFDYVQDTWRLVGTVPPPTLRWEDINANRSDRTDDIERSAFRRGTATRIVRAIFRYRPRLLLFGSSAPYFLRIVKLLSFTRVVPSALVMIWHEQLGGMIREDRDTIQLYRDIYRVAHSLNSSRSFQLVLSPSIKACLTELDPSLAHLVHPLHLPCLWKTDALPAEQPISPIIFGHLGAIYKAKGFDKFIELAQRVSAEFPEAEFVSIGKVLDEPDAYDYQQTVKVSKETLLPEEYDARARNITYSVITSSPSHYRVVASLSFLDGLSYGKPGIYLRNPFIEYCFQMMGDIGYLCDTYEEMATTMSEIMRNFPYERYRQQCQNIFAHRDIFHAASVGRELRSILQPVVDVTTRR